MICIEFHCHTRYSKDSLTSPKKLIETCRKKGIQRVVITDHNTIAGACVAQALDPELVIIGEEIMTTQGELLAAFVQQEVPPGLSPQEAITELRAQGAFISVSHPFDRWRSGHWQEEHLLEILPLIDAIETFNARCMLPSFNHRTRDFAEQHGISGTAGSDAHAAYELGKAAMVLPPFQDALSFKHAFKSVRFDVSLSPPWVHLSSRYAVWRKSLAS